MGKIYYLMGKSASGKDTIFHRLLEDGSLSLKTCVPYTTRPIRSGELEGREYFFVNGAQMKDLRDQGKIIEERVYHTIHGPWHYFTADDGQIDIKEGNYLLIGTLESFLGVSAYYGREIVVPVYINVEDGLRLYRALERERAQEHPKYQEMCRRFLADSEDFSEEHLKQAGIEKIFENNDLEICINEIRELIRKN